jgi:hypothetical protein
MSHAKIFPRSQETSFMFYAALYIRFLTKIFPQICAWHAMCTYNIIRQNIYSSCCWHLAHHILLTTCNIRHTLLIPNGFLITSLGYLVIFSIPVYQNNCIVRLQIFWSTLVSPNLYCFSPTSYICFQRLPVLVNFCLRPEGPQTLE